MMFEDYETITLDLHPGQLRRGDRFEVGDGVVTVTDVEEKTKYVHVSTDDGRTYRLMKSAEVRVDRDELTAHGREMQDRVETGRAVWRKVSRVEEDITRRRVQVLEDIAGAGDVRDMCRIAAGEVRSEVELELWRRVGRVLVGRNPTTIFEAVRIVRDRLVDDMLMGHGLYTDLVMRGIQEREREAHGRWARDFVVEAAVRYAEEDAR